MVSRFNCSSSSSYDDNGTTVTDYTNDTRSYYDNDDGNDKGNDDGPSARLFQAADEMIQSLFAAGTISCGLDQFQKGGGNRGGAGGSNTIDIDEGIKLDWRKDPYRSMSDWTLIVRDGSKSQQPQSYHIHKSVLSYGQRKSGFFVRVFEKDILEGNSRRKKDGGSTDVALTRRAAQSVPQLLDFIYFDKLDLDASCAVSLRYLANTFDVRELYALVSSFIQSDIANDSTITTYIREAEAVKDNELLKLAMSYAAAKFDTLPNESLLQLPPHSFQQLTSNPQLNVPSSELLSQRIAFYARNKSDEINDEVFYFLTHAQILPCICSTEAMWYMTFASSKFGNVLVDDSMGGYGGTLKRRCIIAAAKDWRDILVGPVREEMRQRIEGGGSDSNTGAVRGESPRRRLFVDGDDETNIDKGRGYLSLPMDIRVELLEEAILNAAAAAPEEGNNNVETSTILQNNKIDTLIPTQLEPEQRTEVDKKRKSRKGRREKRVMV
jgi:hypothetical protein